MAGVPDKVLAEVDRDAPALELLRAALTRFMQAMDDNLPGLLADVDAEPLHEFRVAVRRTRATLKLGRPALPDGVRDRWEPELKWVGTLTTPVRDLDVVQLELSTMGSWLDTADMADLTSLASHLNRRRTAERDALLRGLGSERFARLRSEWAGTIAGMAASTPDSGARPMSVGDLARRSISRASRRVLRSGAGIRADSPAADLHALRKRCKELRYALEVFSPVLEKASRKRVVKDMKGLQDVLGRFQDAEVQLRVLRGFAETEAGGVAAETVLAVGELMGHLVGVQEVARQELDASFARLAGKGSTRRLRSLAGAGSG
jgi:CHAD domain-containing protein